MMGQNDVELAKTYPTLNTQAVGSDRGALLGLCKCIPAGLTTYVASYHVLLQAFTTKLSHLHTIFKILSEEKKSVIHQQPVN